MTGSGAGQPQRYCTNCGAQIRPGTVFCVSCGAPLTTGAGQPEPDDTGSEQPSGRSDVSAGGFGEGLRSVPSRAGQWFGGLPIVGKAALAGLLVLALFTVLSPLAAVVAAVVFAASLIALIIRVAQRRSVVGWGTTAVASLVLAFAFSGMAGAFYGGGDTAGSEPDSRDAGYAEGSRDHGEANATFGNGTIAECLGDDETDAASSYKVVDADTYEESSKVTGIAMVVAVSANDVPGPILGELQAQNADYDAMEILAYAREWASYDPDTGAVTSLPGAPAEASTRWYIATSPDGEALLGLDDLQYHCGSSYGSGYRWGVPPS